MKKLISALLVLAMILSLGISCFADETAAGPAVVDDGRDRPSVCGSLQVANGKLSDSEGNPVMLRGISTYGLSVTERLINQKLFTELSEVYGVNIVRLAMYTYGTGVVGYCNGGDKNRIKNTVIKGVEYAKNADMYAIIDWHVLQDCNPLTYIEDAKLFFEEMSSMFCDYNNVIYEICNEPNHTDWSDICAYANEIIPIIRANDPDSVIIVGTPNWSQRIDEALANPLDYENLMYTFHFYAASHGQELRDMVSRTSQAGLPVFVTEYGITSSSGGFPIDTESADLWIDMLEEENISYCLWSFSNIPEACSALLYACKKNYGLAPEDFSETGNWLINTLQERFEASK